uniref:Uncharacterized protein n=1 Tax=Arundo donax TaxID=35708 RepID=A0A0A9FYJ4_ARUDO
MDPTADDAVPKKVSDTASLPRPLHCGCTK